jgi:hypothetical protein
VFAEFESFMQEVRHGAPDEPDRVLATVLFTDIVGFDGEARGARRDMA